MLVKINELELYILLYVILKIMLGKKKVSCVVLKYLWSLKYVK